MEAHLQARTQQQKKPHEERIATARASVSLAFELKRCSAHGGATRLIVITVLIAGRDNHYPCSRFIHFNS
ncbi:hypothetical protein E2C01_032258 [Portunus trituberculatus]|uniref:Uncharacterized protein n=1 Tax=Portunus trituberculatus TaxID=210409 RepID=A0A5B7EZ72_PORTR|nr:hypothetical protein [Portunus trituberculatus]